MHDSFPKNDDIVTYDFFIYIPTIFVGGDIQMYDFFIKKKRHTNLWFSSIFGKKIAYKRCFFSKM